MIKKIHKMVIIPEFKIYKLYKKIVILILIIFLILVFLGLVLRENFRLAFINTLLVTDISELENNIINLEKDKILLYNEIEQLEDKLKFSKLSMKEKVDRVSEIILTENPSIKGKSKLFAKSYVIISEYDNIDLALILGIGRVESVFKQRITSHAGAEGIQQIMPSTMRILSKSMKLPTYEINDIITNISASAFFLNDLLNKYPIEQALTYYNEGGDPKTLKQRTEKRLQQKDSYVNLVLFYRNKYYKMLYN